LILHSNAYFAMCIMKIASCGPQTLTDTESHLQFILLSWQHRIIRTKTGRTKRTTYIRVCCGTYQPPEDDWWVCKVGTTLR